MRISIFGSGYVGLVTGACLADAGHEVMCVDIDEEKIANLKKGIIPIYEPGLTDLIHSLVEKGNLDFTTDSATAINFGEVLFIAVGTPPDENGEADMQYVLQVAATIGTFMDGYKIIVDKSTVPVGTAEKVQAEIQQKLDARKEDLEFSVCSNPEFLKEGSAIDDFKNCDRVVIGTDSDNVRIIMQDCYKSVPKEKILFMSIRAAELTKYAANAMLATKISFMNEMANIAESLNIDIEDVKHGIGTDKRIGFHFINPGCGYGGSCFPKDVNAIIKFSENIGYRPRLLRAVEQVNQDQKNKLFEKLLFALEGNLKDKRIAVWGLAFKPNTDDMREAPSRNLIEALFSEDSIVQAYDPVAMNECKRLYENEEKLHLCMSKEEAIINADALVICTEWSEFKSIDIQALGEKMKAKIVVDGRNLYDPNHMKLQGFDYFAIGRGIKNF